ncbi:MAG: DUF4290 domain-containing protein [Capnocytophaga sp.]|nr:DUF4290 domain-containing protein [Capnocytophaga sp.]
MEQNLEYNTLRNPLVIPEYGRHIQKMVEKATKTEDRALRNNMAKAIIAIMGNQNPHLRDVPDFQHKLWDQLFKMSNFQIDVDSPFEKPTPETITPHPERMQYPQKHPKYRFYGNNILRLIEVCNLWEEGELKSALQLSIANHMKKCFLAWNKESVEDDVIFEHLYELSKGKIDLKKSEQNLNNNRQRNNFQKKFTNKKNNQNTQNNKKK